MGWGDARRWKPEDMRCWRGGGRYGDFSLQFQRGAGLEQGTEHHGKCPEGSGTQGLGCSRWPCSDGQGSHNWGGGGVEYVSIYRPVLTECQEPGIDGACGEEAWLEWWDREKDGKLGDAGGGRFPEQGGAGQSAQARDGPQGPQLCVGGPLLALGRLGAGRAGVESGRLGWGSGGRKQSLENSVL